VRDYEAILAAVLAFFHREPVGRYVGASQRRQEKDSPLLTIPLPCRMYVHNPLSVKHFHKVSAGNGHECSLKLSIGIVR
jgi:hypothetical protein